MKLARSAVVALACASALVPAGSALADDGTVVPGQHRYDADSNGYTDAGQVVTGRYTQASGGCTYQVSYRGDFGNDEYLDSGWIINNIRCGKDVYHVLVVTADDPRWSADGQDIGWGAGWLAVSFTQSGAGQLLNPHKHVDA